MNGERIFNLCIELIERMEVANKEGKTIKMKDVDKDFFFVHDGEKEYVNPRYLSFEKHCEIKQLSDFVRLHADIDDEILKEILKMNKTRLQFLIEVQSVVPNLVEEIRNHDDERYVSYLYATNKMYSEKQNSLSL